MRLTQHREELGNIASALAGAPRLAGGSAVRRHRWIAIHGIYYYTLGN